MRTTKSDDNVLFIGDIRSRLDYYMEVIALAMRKKADVLMLLPDHYAAGSYFRRILSEKFGDRVLWYGSGTHRTIENGDLLSCESTGRISRSR